MTPQIIAKQLIGRIKQDPLFTRQRRFNVEVWGRFRIYGRIADRPIRCFMLQSVWLDEGYRGKGLFTALVEEALKEWGLPVYVQSVENEAFASALRNNPLWESAPGGVNFIRRK
jgi:GNAT superfamily N-acetyltransferase